MALGEERNTYEENLPGRYKDPQSQAELTVTMHAGADALVRLGWVRIGDVEEDQIKDPYAEAEKTEAPAKEEPAKAKVKK